MEKQMTREQKIAELNKRKLEASQDPAAFIKHFCFTFNPKVEPYHFPFKLFSFQIEKIVRELQWAIDNGEDIFFDKSREMGATYTVLDVFLWYWLYVPGSNFLLGSRKEAYVDNTKDNGTGIVSNKEESLFGKLEYTINHLPGFLLPKGFNIRKHFGYMNLTNPENGNVITGESSNPNFSRGGRQKAILLDEFAFWENDSSAWGATADTTDCRVVVTTPGIKPGKAKRLRFGAEGEKIKIVELDYSLDPRKDAVWIARQRERRSAEDFAREIMRNWDTSVKGRVYPEIEMAEIGEFPYNPDWPLFVAWDFGLDGIPIQWWQKNLANGKMRLVEAFMGEDQPIQYFFPFFPENLVDSMFSYEPHIRTVIDKTTKWKKGVHVGDPDVNKRSVVSKDKTSTRKELEKAGIYIQTKPEANQFFIRRDKTKVMFQRGIEVNDTDGTKVWVEALQQARYPQRAETSESTKAITLPIHDWTSHHRTATEYLAVNLDGSFTASQGEDPYKKHEGYKQDDAYNDKGYLL